MERYQKTIAVRDEIRETVKNWAAAAADDPVSSAFEVIHQRR